MAGHHGPSRGPVSSGRLCAQPCTPAQVPHPPCRPTMSLLACLHHRAGALKAACRAHAKSEPPPYALESHLLHGPFWSCCSLERAADDGVLSRQLLHAVDGPAAALRQPLKTSMQGLIKDQGKRSALVARTLDTLQAKLDLLRCRAATVRLGCCRAKRCNPGI